MTALSFNEDTYYVGFDANQGAELQGTMVMDYIQANIDTIDRNGDGEPVETNGITIRFCVYENTAPLPLQK